MDKKNKLFYIGIEWIVCFVVLLITDYIYATYGFISTVRVGQSLKTILTIITKNYIYTGNVLFIGFMIIYVSIFFDIKNVDLRKIFFFPLFVSVVSLVAIVIMLFNTIVFDRKMFFGLIVFITLSIRLIWFIYKNNCSNITNGRLLYKVVLAFMIMMHVALLLYAVYGVTLDLPLEKQKGTNGKFVECWKNQ